MEADDVDAREQALIARAKGGDENALAELFLANESRVRSVVRKMGLSGADLEDAVQETRVLAWRGLNGFRGECTFSTWMCTIAKNRAKNALAAARRRPHGHYVTDCEVAEHLLESLPTATGTPEQLLIARRMNDKFGTEVACLPDPMREAFQLRVFAGLSYQEIARRQKCPIGTVRSRLFRAVEILRQKL